MFRVIHVDGAIGGITPAGFLHVSLYSERAAIPREIVHKVNPEGTLGIELKQNTRGGIVREMESDLMLSIPAAQSLYDWLGRHLESARKQKLTSDKVS